MKKLLLPLGAGLLAIAASALAIRHSAETADYTAHEWGTFTSVQGADGEQMAWNPRSASELPGFVYDRTGQPEVLPLSARSFGKIRYVCRQRMETPVIYFYSATPRTVDVAVEFPKGMFTEWFPRLSPVALNERTRPIFRWSNVQILPREADASAKLRTDSSGSHYYGARDTEANLVRVGTGAAAETEKFLFYRGIGDFVAPLKVTIPEGTRLNLENTGREALRGLFVSRVERRSSDGASQPVVSFQHVAALSPGQSASVNLDASEPGAEQSRQLEAQLREALTEAGLYGAEAAAMVKTWKDSWLGEPGVRVLYLLPQTWTESVLPLAITPAPREVKRVMVGRAEVITPSMERAVAAEVNRFHSGDEAQQKLAVANARALGLGRFFAAAVERFAVQHSNDQELGRTAWKLANLASARP